ncbi:MAG: hypothetical protein O3A01_08730, partial [bacterium]|nr:hypothetical protein [bacterium]
NDVLLANPPRLNGQFQLAANGGIEGLQDLAAFYEENLSALGNINRPDEMDVTPLQYALGYRGVSVGVKTTEPVAEMNWEMLGALMMVKGPETLDLTKPIFGSIPPMTIMMGNIIKKYANNPTLTTLTQADRVMLNFIMSQAGVDVLMSGTADMPAPFTELYGLLAQDPAPGWALNIEDMVISAYGQQVMDRPASASTNQDVRTSFWRNQRLMAAATGKTNTGVVLREHAVIQDRLKDDFANSSVDLNPVLGNSAYLNHVVCKSSDPSTAVDVTNTAFGTFDTVSDSSVPPSETQLESESQQIIAEVRRQLDEQAAAIRDAFQTVYGDFDSLDPTQNLAMLTPQTRQAVLAKRNMMQQLASIESKREALIALEEELTTAHTEVAAYCDRYGDPQTESEVQALLMFQMQRTIRMAEIKMEMLALKESPSDDDRMVSRQLGEVLRLANKLHTILSDNSRVNRKRRSRLLKSVMKEVSGGQAKQSDVVFFLTGGAKGFRKALHREIARPTAGGDAGYMMGSPLLSGIGRLTSAQARGRMFRVVTRQDAQERQRMAEAIYTHITKMFAARFHPDGTTPGALQALSVALGLPITQLIAMLREDGSETTVLSPIEIAALQQLAKLRQADENYVPVDGKIPAKLQLWMARTIDVAIIKDKLVDEYNKCVAGNSFSDPFNLRDESTHALLEGSVHLTALRNGISDTGESIGRFSSQESSTLATALIMKSKSGQGLSLGEQIWLERHILEQLEHGITPDAGAQSYVQDRIHGGTNAANVSHTTHRLVQWAIANPTEVFGNSSQLLPPEEQAWQDMFAKSDYIAQLSGHAAVGFIRSGSGADLYARVMDRSEPYASKGTELEALANLAAELVRMDGARYKPFMDRIIELGINEIDRDGFNPHNDAHALVARVLDQCLSPDGQFRASSMAPKMTPAMLAKAKQAKGVIDRALDGGSRADQRARLKEFRTRLAGDGTNLSSVEMRGFGGVFGTGNGFDFTVPGVGTVATGQLPVVVTLDASGNSFKTRAAIGYLSEMGLPVQVRDATDRDSLYWAKDYFVTHSQDGIAETLYLSDEASVTASGLRPYAEGVVRDYTP